MIIKERPLIFDGAMGTYYASICENPLAKCELANIYDRETILNIHKEYISAGSQAIKTNTFGANCMSLESDFSLVKEVITEGYKIAQEAVKGTEVLVFADLGPIPFLKMGDLWEEYKKTVDLFLDLGAE
ncbi:MAG: bifunctional homocysteine S-methyltransferase/methylenetetrahydrofolate reductase, partial [Clostridia bacterium]|nr:bifunctional homocysteine S-methyltransferase/methylenetetrahydrofolate reductase [Clostridia bacterium]